MQSSRKRKRESPVEQEQEEQKPQEVQEVQKAQESQAQQLTLSNASVTSTSATSISTQQVVCSSQPHSPQPPPQQRDIYNHYIKLCLKPFLINDLIPIILGYTQTIQFILLHKWTCNNPPTGCRKYSLLALERDEVILANVENGNLACFHLETGKYLRSTNLRETHPWHNYRLNQMVSDGKNIFVAQFSSIRVLTLDTLQVVRQWCALEGLSKEVKDELCLDSEIYINGLALKSCNDNSNSNNFCSSSSSTRSSRSSSRSSDINFNSSGNRCSDSGSDYSELFVAFQYISSKGFPRIKKDCIVSFSKANGMFSRKILNTSTDNSPRACVKRDMCVYDNELFICFPEISRIKIISLDSLKADEPLYHVFYPEALDVHGEFVYTVSRERSNHITVINRTTGSLAKIITPWTGSFIQSHDRDLYNNCQNSNAQLDPPTSLKISYDNKLVVFSSCENSISIFA